MKNRDDVKNEDGSDQERELMQSSRVQWAGLNKILVFILAFMLCYTQDDSNAAEGKQR